MFAGAVRALMARTYRLSICGELDAGARFLFPLVSERSSTREKVRDFSTFHFVVLCAPLDDIDEDLNGFETSRTESCDAPVVLAFCCALSPREAAALG